MKRIPYVDLHPVDEDTRIKMIVEQVRTGQVVGVFLERNEPEKIERYIKKVTELLPTAKVVGRTNHGELLILIKFQVQQ